MIEPNFPMFFERPPGCTEFFLLRAIALDPATEALACSSIFTFFRPANSLFASFAAFPTATVFLGDADYLAVVGFLPIGSDYFFTVGDISLFFPPEFKDN